jgi:hypothetical protein
MKVILFLSTFLSIALAPIPAWADTPPPGIVGIKDPSNNQVTSTNVSGKQGLDVNVVAGGATTSTSNSTVITGVAAAALNADTIAATSVTGYRSMSLSWTSTGSSGTAAFQVQESVDGVTYYPANCSTLTFYPYFAGQSNTFISGGTPLPGAIHCKIYAQFMRTRVSAYSGNGSVTATAFLMGNDSYGVQGPQTTHALVDNLGNSVNGSSSVAVSNTSGGSILAGQNSAATSLSTALANEDVQDLFITGQSAQTATVNNILPASSGANATDMTGYRSCDIQVVSTGTAGTFIFEGANDNVNFQTLPVWNQLILTGTPITAAITATASQIIYTFPVAARYVRLRIATTITGGSIQAFTKCSQSSFAPAILQVAQSVGANLATQTVISSGTVTTVTNGNLGFPSVIADVASAAITTTTTTGAFTPTFGCTYQVNIPVTVVTGTTPTMDVEIQESRDSGTNWVAIYDFPRITATGSYNSPVMTLTGNRVRYVQTIAGTTPSFTRAINRVQDSADGGLFTRQIVDRTIALGTLASTTVALNIEQQTPNIMLTINIGAATTPPSVQVQCSEDAGVTYYKIGSPLAALANTTVSSTISNTTCQLAQAVVTTAGTGVTAGYVLVRGFR